MTHTGTVFPTRDLGSKINGFTRLIMKHLCVKFGDPSCIGFRDIMREKTDRQTNASENITPATAVGVGKERIVFFDVPYLVLGNNF